MLMVGAPPGQRRPGPAESADLIRSGLWLRLRPGVPRSARTVRAAVKLMYAGAAVSTVNLVIFLALIGDIKAYHAILGHRLTAAQLSQASTSFITVCILWNLVPIAVWLLWRPASRAYFKPPGYTQAQHQAQIAELDHRAQMAELARIRARLPRHV